MSMPIVWDINYFFVFIKENIENMSGGKYWDENIVNFVVGMPASPASFAGSLVSKRVTIFFLKRLYAILIVIAAIRIWISVLCARG
ncbi:MAG: hypothetical protein AMJ60_07810 [Desulfobacterales bacterium SG8_35]|nr:MAG: hypothetical protein AMJ60_07810 [Desulfobacterales bacterium SG8_35]